MYAKNYLKAVGDTKAKDTNTVISETTKGTMVGAAIGAGIGIFIGFGRKKNLLMSGFVGAIIGGAISRIFIK
jgi:uncharacterized protein YqgC (DUF456 family)